MKKIFVTGLLSLCGLMTFGQTLRKPISYLPQQANHFLVLNSVDFRTVTTWKINIQTRALNATHDGYNYTTVKSFDLSTYYTKIDDAYLKDEYYLTIQGMDARGTTLTSQGPLAMNGDSHSTACHWDCIGRTYAYRLNLWVSANGGSSHVKMAEIRDPFEFQWVGDDNWIHFINEADPYYYGLSSFSMTDPGNPGTVIHVVLPVGETHEDEMGTSIAGSMYGVRKYFGPWAGDYNMMESTEHAAGDSYCDMDINAAIAMINDNPAVPEHIVCTGVGQEGGEPPEPVEYCQFSNIESYVEFANCMYAQSEALSGLAGITNNPGGFHWPSGVVAITLQTYNSPGGVNNPIVLSEKTLFDDAGNYIGSPINFETGLYTIGVQYLHGKYRTSFFESKAPSTYRLQQKDFLDVVAFPNPITGNTFSLRFVAQSKLKFTYSLKDERGHEYFSKTYELTKGQDLTDLIDVRSGLPSGFLFNKITFEDGSEINFKTIK
ncbi:MAG: hypothetical protein JWP12_345 [Bacteroidetes bacterium]|nr:hypothetical protein [Bacteroidota bacterium]